MNGAVDSSVAAYLMKKDGYRCIGTTMRLYRNSDIGLNKLDLHPGHRNTYASEGKDQIQTEGTMGDGLSTGGRPDKTHLR